MFKKLGDRALNLVVILERWICQIQKLLTPAIKIGTIISVLYSVLAIILLFQKKMPPALIQSIRDFPYNQEILTALMVISFATLVLSGGIIEVLRFCGFAAEFSLSSKEEPYDSWDDPSLIGGILEIILILLPFVLVAVFSKISPWNTVPAIPFVLMVSEINFAHSASFFEWVPTAGTRPDQYCHNHTSKYEAVCNMSNYRKSNKSLVVPRHGITSALVDCLLRRLFEPIWFRWIHRSVLCVSGWYASYSSSTWTVRSSVLTISSPNSSNRS